MVTYDTKVRLDFGLMHMNETNKEETKAIVKAIRDGSSTNLCGGLIKGTVLQACTTFRVVTTTQMSQVKIRTFINNGVCYIILHYLLPVTNNDIFLFVGISTLFSACFINLSHQVYA